MSMANLLFTWKSEGRNTEAAQLMQQCVQLLVPVLGPKYPEGHPDANSSLSTLESWLRTS
ncbi:hypothetical protein HD806DRAFT_508310 [Xylariaceae sp. AK1471]|nr:hypothetical protein HD806DRAFT_508310 [Xylariaceae sp. AK1471]